MDSWGNFKANTGPFGESLQQVRGFFGWNRAFGGRHTLMSLMIQGLKEDSTPSYSDTSLGMLDSCLIPPAPTYAQISFCNGV